MSLLLYHIRILNSDKLEILNFAFKYFNVFIFIMCPVDAFLIWLFFRKYNLNFIENLVLAAYMSGQTMFFYCIILIPFILFTSIMVAIGTITGILLACWSVMAILWNQIFSQYYQSNFYNYYFANLITGIDLFFFRHIRNSFTNFLCCHPTIRRVFYRYSPSPLSYPVKFLLLFPALSVVLCSGLWCKWKSQTPSGIQKITGE